MNVERYTVEPGSRVSLNAFDPSDTDGFESKTEARKFLEQDIAMLADLQDKLNAQARHGVLIVFQGMDTAGKDGAIKHVMTGVNPAGVIVYSFKQPSAEETRHDYLWRAAKALPERGRMSIFNRSYYEDVIVTRVHPQLLGQFEEEAEKHGKSFWEQRFADINNFERYLTNNDIVVLKFFLHISKEEQKKRLLERLDDPTKQWKFSEPDLQERAYWGEYVNAYEHMLSNTSTAWAPWHVIPANHKWFGRLAVANILVEQLQQLHPAYPELPPHLRQRLAEARAAIEAET
ncbi:MAG: polyphosphate kinase 2 family protein [Vulcanimicrobiaceae bacterium]